MASFTVALLTDEIPSQRTFSLAILICGPSNEAERHLVDPLRFDFDLHFTSGNNNKFIVYSFRVIHMLHNRFY